MISLDLVIILLFVYTLRKKLNIFFPCSIWGSHSGGHEVFCLLEYNGLHDIVFQKIELFVFMCNSKVMFHRSLQVEPKLQSLDRGRIVM
jgi:hypothetical protein